VTPDSSRLSARHITITGVVQGVGFRPFVYNLARTVGITGWVLNHSGGVEIEAEGTREALDDFLRDLETKAPPLAHIESLNSQSIAPQGFDAFEIRHSKSQEGRYQLISPDVATCPDCLTEILDPADRRYRYPFTNCTNCGPRFTIIEDIPYDRPKTTMRVFPMCDDCRAEYEDPANRRFHAQPNACPVCGPRVWLVETDESAARLKTHDSRSASRVLSLESSTIHHPASDGALRRATELLLAGHIVAVKGLGGFQLACDATNEGAVATLRERKRRPHKPFAVMVATLEEARELCEVNEEAERLLTSPQCPIVLMDARADTPIADGVTPNTHTLGVMLAYTPLHHILLRDVARPLVMTSGNLSEEPIAKDNDEALRRLAPLADAFLLHDRDIHARYDDSVVAVMRERLKTQDSRSVSRVLSPESFSIPVRRARGYAPFPVRLPFEGPQVFAAGPLLKNTFTLTRDRYAFVSQHIGDLENLETLEHYETALRTYQHLFRIEPELVTADLHPDYMSTRLAESFAEDHGLPAPHRVQHHKAHTAACMADNGWPADAGPVIGVALDGTGYGEDGQIWGGEWFIGDYSGFERVAHLEALPLPGGDAAIRHPWRTAVAYLHALELDDGMPLGEFCPADVMRVRTMVDRSLNTPQTSSMGRLFDAVSALLGVCTEATYEAQAAIELEQLATGPGSSAGLLAQPYPFDLGTETVPYQIGARSLLDAILQDLERGEPAAQIGRCFHTTIAEMVVTVCRQLRADREINTVALSGGVFQNRLLTTQTLSGLSAAGFEVLYHRQVPPNDGGISLGQAAMASFAHR